MTNFTVEQTGTAEIDTGAYPPEGVASNKTPQYCKAKVGLNYTAWTKLLFGVIHFKFNK